MRHPQRGGCRDRQKRQPAEGRPNRRRRVEPHQTAIGLGPRDVVLPDEVRGLAGSAEIDAGPADRFLTHGHLNGRRAALPLGGGEAREVVALFGVGRDAVAAGVAGQRGAEIALAQGQVEQVLLKELLRLLVGHVVRSADHVKAPSQPLVDRSPQGVRALVGRTVVEHRELHLAVGPGRGHEPELHAAALTPFRVPVVEERRVLAAAEHEKERVAHVRAVNARRPVRRHQDAGRPLVRSQRVIDDRRVENRHALDAKHRVPGHQPLIEHDRTRRQLEVPPGRRLNAGRVPTLRQPVGARTDPLDLLGAELDVRLEGAERTPSRLRAAGDPGPAHRAIEGAEPRRAIQFHPLRHHVEAGLLQQHVARRDDGRRGPLHAIRVQLRVVAGDHDVTFGVSAVPAEIEPARALDVPDPAGSERRLGLRARRRGHEQHRRGAEGDQD